ncbi:MAG: hypothetical protein WBM00_01100 [Solirubrobacterales bacterium]
MAVQLMVLLIAFVAGTGTAEAVGAVNLGTALSIGQLTFTAALAWVLLR